MATSIKNLSEYDKANISNGADYKIGIVVSEWNESISSKLLDGALQTFHDNGVLDENILIIMPPTENAEITDNITMPITPLIPVRLLIKTIPLITDLIGTYDIHFS